MNIGEAISKLEHINWRYCTGDYDVAMQMAINALRDEQKSERYSEIMQAEHDGRLIDANVLIEWCRPHGHTGEPISFETLVEYVQVQPTIDPESLRPVGRFEEIDDFDGDIIYRCSACKDERYYPEGHPLTEYGVNFCPNCGAKMEGGNG